MKVFTRFISLLVVVVMGTALFASCKNGAHTHDYKAVVTEPSCVAGGYTTHSCSCGDEYTDSQVPAIGHSFTSEIKRFPNATQKGLRVNVCSDCGKMIEHEIDGVQLIIPEVSDLLVKAFGPIKLKWSAEGNLQKIGYSTKYEDGVSSLLGNKEVCAFTLEEAEINTLSGEFVGFFKYSVESNSTVFDPALTVDSASSTSNLTGIYLFINGNHVAISIESDGHVYNSNLDLNNVVYALIGEMTGSFELASILQVVEIAVNYLPEFMGAFKALTLDEIVNKAYVDKVDGLVGLFLEDGLVAKEDGENTLLEINFDALNIFVNEIDGKLLKEYLNEVYGEGSFDKICEFIQDMPEMKIREISNTIITLSESCNIDINRVYDVIDLLIFNKSGVNESIVNVIQQMHDLTFYQVAQELALVPESSFTLEEMKAEFTALTEELAKTTIDEVFALYFGTSESVIDLAKDIIALLPEYFTVELVYDSSDLLKALRVNGQSTIAGALDEIEKVVSEFVESPVIDAVFEEVKNIYGDTDLVYLLQDSMNIELDVVVRAMTNVIGEAFPEYEELASDLERLIVDLFNGTVSAPQINAQLLISALLKDISKIADNFISNEFVEAVVDELSVLYDDQTVSNLVGATENIPIDSLISSVANVVEVLNGSDGELISDVENALKMAIDGTVTNPSFNSEYVDNSDDLVDLQTTVDGVNGLTALKATVRKYVVEPVGEFVYNETTQMEEWVKTGEIEHLIIANVEYSRNIEDNSELVKYILTYDGEEQLDGSINIKENKIVSIVKEGAYTKQIKIEKNGNTNVCTVYAISGGKVMEDATFTIIQKGAKMECYYDVIKYVTGIIYYNNERFEEYYCGSGSLKTEIVVG